MNTKSNIKRNQTILRFSGFAIREAKVKTEVKVKVKAGTKAEVETKAKIEKL